MSKLEDETMLLNAFWKWHGYDNHEVTEAMGTYRETSQQKC